jgi:hypothetical protein
MHSTICEKSQKCLTKGLNLQPYSWQMKLNKEITYPCNFPLTRVGKIWSFILKSIQESGMEGLHSITKKNKYKTSDWYNNMFPEPIHTLKFAPVCRCTHTYGQLSYRILQHYKQTNSVFNIWLYPVPTYTNPISGYKERLKKVILGQQP